MFIKQNIAPTQYIYPVRIIHSIEIQIINLRLFEGVSVMVSLYDENNNIIENKMIDIVGNDYLNWSNDDSYLIDIVLNKLNLMKL